MEPKTFLWHRKTRIAVASTATVLVYLNIGIQDMRTSPACLAPVDPRPCPFYSYLTRSTACNCGTLIDLGTEVLLYIIVPFATTYILATLVKLIYGKLVSE